MDKFYIAEQDGTGAQELDLFVTAKMLKPADPSEVRKPIPQEFYALLDRNKAAFEEATSVESESASARRGSTNDAYILKRLKAKDIRRYQGFRSEEHTS